MTPPRTGRAVGAGAERPTRLRWLLLLPFLAPAVALVLSAAAERGTVELLAEHCQGRLIPYRGSHRVVVFGLYSPHVWIFDLDGQRVGEMDGPGMSREALVAGRRVLYIGSEQEAVVGRLPLEGGEVRGVKHPLPAPVPASYLHAYFPVRVGPRRLALACPNDVTLLRTTAGWVGLSPRGARAVSHPPAECREMKPLGYRPEVPIPGRRFLKTRLGGRTAAVGAAYAPVAYVTGVTPDRARLLRVAPPSDQPTRGTALVSGCWVLLAGRRCRMGELRLTLGCLTDPPGRPHRWSERLLFDSFPGCRPDHVPAASICGGQLQLELPKGRAAWRLEDGARVAPTPRSGGRCTRMRRLRGGRPAWAGGRALEVGEVLYRVEAGPRIRASVGGTVKWSRPLPGAGHILGATDRQLLVQLVPDRLHALDRRDGRPIHTARVPELHDPIEKRPSLTQWIGHVGPRAYFLLVRSQRWLQRIRETHLMMYDGERLRRVD